MLTYTEPCPAAPFTMIDCWNCGFEGGVNVGGVVGVAPDPLPEPPDDEIPGETDQSTAMSRDLRERGFRFVGPTICYALMQSAGLVNDHVVTCFRHGEVAALG